MSHDILLLNLVEASGTFFQTWLKAWILSRERSVYVLALASLAKLDKLFKFFKPLFLIYKMYIIISMFKGVVMFMWDTACTMVGI